MNKLSNLFSEYKFIIIGLLLFVFILIGAFFWKEHSSRYHLFVKFTKSAPLYNRMPVFYKGYRLGEVKEVTISDDYKYSLVNIVIFPKKPKLPKDINVEVKNHDVFSNYIDLIDSDEPSDELLKSGDIIEGTPGFELGSFLAEIQDSGLLIPLIQNFSDAALSLNRAGIKIGDFFVDSRTVLTENKQNLKHTTDSLNKLTTNFSVSFSKDKLNETTSSVNKSATNIQTITESVKNITQNVDCATRNLDQTVAKIDSTITEAHATVSNTKAITSGFCEVLSKRFAGLRIVFGKPLKNNRCPKNCSR